jgi:hypothetical protein
MLENLTFKHYPSKVWILPVQKLKPLEVDAVVLVKRSSRRNHLQPMSTIMVRDDICLMFHMFFETLAMHNEPKPY